jgi:hypothetical protein
LSVPHRTGSGSGFGEQTERCRRNSFGNAGQGKTGIKSLPFLGTRFIRCKKSGDDRNFVTAGKEDVGIPPSTNAERGFPAEGQPFFFLSSSPASRAPCSSNCR